MDKRFYNKLYVPRNRTGTTSIDKIMLGYKYNAKDLLLYKDKETYFHVPYFTSSVSLADSSLIEDGAIAGPFPAAADRIFKNKKDYGNVTANGDPTDIADGVWFCSWLKKMPNGTSVWMDRWYNPGKFNYDSAIIELNEVVDYIPNNPVFADRPSTMYLEPGVMYRYYHIGERTAKELLNTFAGLSSQYLKLNLTEWNSEQADTSPAPKTVRVIGVDNEQEVFSTTKSSTFVEKKAIDFNTAYDTEVWVEYNSDYNPIDEFSWSFWAQSSDWQNCPSTQLIGNYCSNGGVGVFIETLSSYPFFVLPETRYGHLIYLNEAGNVTFDKSTYTLPALTSTPSCGLIINEEANRKIPKISAPHFVALNFDNHAFILQMDQTGTLIKVDCTGKVLNSKTGFFNTDINETPHQMICNQQDGVIVITNRSVYSFDANLQLLDSHRENFSETSLVAYKYDPIIDTCILKRKNNVKDLKYDQQDEWYISSTNHNLYKNGQVFVSLEDQAQAFAIDPKNRIWVMHGTGNISVYKNEKVDLMVPLFVVRFENQVINKRNNISFLCKFDRKTKQRSWQAVIHYSESDNVFMVDLDGRITKTIEKYTIFNTNVIVALRQDSSNFEFLAKGDFTGYEHKRVFSNLSPYRGKSQIVVRAALKDKQAFDLKFHHFKAHYPLQFSPNSYQNFILTHDRQTINLYNNTVPIIHLPYTGRFELDYVLQPLFYIGVPVGTKFSMNAELGYNAATFNGKIADVKIYSYALEANKLEIFLREALKGENLYWSLPSPSTQYVEKVERVFKNKLPGFKSSFFEIKLSGDKIKDPKLRSIIEKRVKEIVEEFKPMTADLLKITWLE